MPKTLGDLTAQEVLALAIQAEEEDGRLYADMARRVEGDFPATAELLCAMHAEEDGHRHRFSCLYRACFGEHIPLVRRQDVKGFLSRKPVWLQSVLTVAMIHREVAAMEESRSFYRAALARTDDAGVANSWATSRRRRTGTTGWRSRSTSGSRRAASETKRTTPSGSVSCSRSCSRGWPG